MASAPEHDLVIVGAGVTDLTAARRAQDLGARVLCVTKWDRGRTPGCNSRMSGVASMRCIWTRTVRRTSSTGRS